MAKYIKGTIGYIPVVDQINRKFTPRKNVCTTTIKGVGIPVELQPAKYMGGGTRLSQRGTYGACSKNYMFFRENPRASAPTVKELTHRTDFSKVIAGRKYINEDLQQVDRVAYMWVGGAIGDKTYEGAKNNKNIHINGVSAEGYTKQGWIFAVQMAGLKNDPAYDVKKFPTDYDA